MTKARILANLGAVTSSATELNTLDGVPATLTATELGYSDALTSAAVGLTDSQTLTNKTLTSPDLGTPSAITLTNATFPAGHIIQVQYSDTTSSVQQSTTNSTKTVCGVAYKELTCRGTGSLYLAQFACATGSQATGSWNGAHQWQGEHSGSWTGWYEANSTAYWYWEDGSDRRQPKTWYTVIAPGSNLAVGEKIRIRAVCFSQHSNAAGFDGRKHEIFMEIKQ